jgi:hypothetical protein
MAYDLSDIYSEPDFDPDTLANLGPLAPMAGVFEGQRGQDMHPANTDSGGEQDVYVERYVLEPIDPQTNGPQLFYGLRYHLHIVKVGEVETFHDQVGYWLWEPKEGNVIQTLAIPRAQIAMACGKAAPDAREFELTAQLGSNTYGICSGEFLDEAFKTTSFSIRVKVESGSRWSYEEETLIKIHGREEVFHHRDANTLTRVSGPSLNPIMAARSGNG